MAYALVAGAGAGLGQALLARFHSGGLHAVGLGRTVPDTTVGEFVKVDLSDPVAARNCLAEVIGKHGAQRS